MNTRFEEKIKAAFGNEGEQWLRQLPETLERLCNQWGVTIEGEPSNLSYNYVAYVQDAMNDFSNEIQATEAFQGEGFVILYKNDETLGGILLERLQPGRMLKEVEKEAQTDIYLEVWNKLNRQASKELPSIHNWFHALVNPVPNDFITQEHIEWALRYKKEIEDTSAGNVHLHGDLHHENILHDHERGWLAIDPKGVQGDIYFDYISFLFNDLNGDLELLETRVKQMAQMQLLDEQRLRKAAIALLTVQVLWAVEDGAEDAKEMNEVLGYLRSTI
ncbi:aminoglycoside phosphotransferase family protein [Ureibacillus aquaedulcis]|uniref:Aminoglycoside phosphotransferase family protein n=1 Tax=Ureibacillus aquaedulcis TaxID=3058421 RepID=A0ABT8GTP5_9BACL|nr:aminoglycoside phosphotransferase family protein [Ureibacillus sp. BA0131]MDN4494749.1 aminoglycoside phosphotransferase family protein [Ureibacillus sp. BA0131]